MRTLLVVAVLAVTITYVTASPKHVLCGGTVYVMLSILFCLSTACKAVVDEVKYAIKTTDQKKTIDIGGREKRPVKYAGSETHLIEILEKVW